MSEPITTALINLIEGRKEQRHLHQAVNRVSDLYFGDLLTAALEDPALQQQRDELWEKVAQDYPEYSAHIMGLRRALQITEQTRKSLKYPEPALSNILSRHLDLRDKRAKGYFENIFYARMVDSSGKVDTHHQSAMGTLQSMAQEMGLKDWENPNKQYGWCSLGAKNISLSTAIQATITGKLGLVHKPLK